MHQPRSAPRPPQRNARPITEKTKLKTEYKKLKIVLRLVQICAARSCSGVSSINNVATNNKKQKKKKMSVVHAKCPHTKSRVRDSRICWPFSQVILADNRNGCLGLAMRFV